MEVRKKRWGQKREEGLQEDRSTRGERVGNVSWFDEEVGGRNLQVQSLNRVGK